MVELVRSSKIFGALVATFLWIFGPLVTHWDHHEDETPDDDVASAIQEKQIAQQAPPPASMPVGNRFIFAQPQNYRHVPQDDSWFMGTPHALLMQLAARRLPVVYVPPPRDSTHQSAPA